MTPIGKAAKDPDWDLFFGGPEWDAAETTRFARELYASLSALVAGEAMVVVRGVTNGNGWEAWSELHDRFDPRTPAKSLMALMAVMQTKKIMDGRELPNVAQDWEVKVKSFEVEHNIALNPKIKVALLTSFPPPNMQELLFQWSESKQSFEEVKDRVLSLAVNRASMSKPTPMEVDRVQAESWHEDYGWYEEQEWGENWPGKQETEVEIDYIGESHRRC